jgi:hypothetical protein
LKSIPISRRSAERLVALGALLAAAFAVTASPAAAATIPAGGIAIEHASLDWAGNQLLQGESEPHAGVNYFSAGVSDGTGATYSAQVGDVSIYNVSAGGTETPATWATRGEHTSTGSTQIVRLSNGVGRIEADGSAKIDWTGSFSVNFYAGAVPFTITDPELIVAADGAGELTGTIMGCAASMGGPGCNSLAPAHVEVATFSGAHIDPEEALTVDPDYAGVEVETTGASTPQNRTVAGWGAWPQSFVDYQIETGLSSYWYSSGHEDTLKVPLPFVVDFTPPVAVDHASLDWTGNELMQAEVHGFKNYFSAGASDGKEATYKGSEGNAEVYLEGSKSIATWATHESYGPGTGERQLVHLSDGTGEFEQYGAAEIGWDGAYSVNFYGGLAPFTIEAPTLVVNEDGTGELMATLVGCEASMADPDECSPFTPVEEVQVATFSGAEISGDELTVIPEYAGVAITTSPQFPQDRTIGGWGSWPQSFVDFQEETGLAPFFYSAGFPEDSQKSPSPFLVDFAGHELSLGAGEEEGTPGGGGTGAGGGSGGQASQGASTTAKRPGTGKPAKLKLGRKRVKLRAGGVVKVATIACPAAGTVCRTVVPSRVAVKIGGKRYALTVIAPKRIGAGRSGAIKVRLSRGARKALGGKKAALRIRVGLVANGVSTKHVVKVKIVGRR